MEELKKICLLGDAEVGKTSLINKYVNNTFGEEYLATVGTRVFKKELEIEGKKMTLLMWDILGQKGYGALKQVYYKGSKGAMAVCDITRPETLEGVEEWINRVKEVEGDIPMVLVCNKNDLEDKKISSEALDAVSGKYNATKFFTSAKTGENVEEAFVKLASMI